MRKILSALTLALVAQSAYATSIDYNHVQLTGRAGSSDLQGFTLSSESQHDHWVVGYRISHDQISEHEIDRYGDLIGDEEVTELTAKLLYRIPSTDRMDVLIGGFAGMAWKKADIQGITSRQNKGLVGADISLRSAITDNVETGLSLMPTYTDSSWNVVGVVYANLSLTDSFSLGVEAANNSLSLHDEASIGLSARVSW